MPIISKAKTIDLGTLEWTLYTSHIFYTIIDDSVLNTNNKTGRIYCDIYKTVTYDVLRNKTIDKTIALGINHVIGIYDSSYSTAASFKAAMSGVMLTYETVDTVEECMIRKSKNLWDEETELGTIQYQDGTPSASVTTLRSKNYIPVIGGNQYYIVSPLDRTMLFYAYDESYQYIGAAVTPTSWAKNGVVYLANRTITVPNNAAFLKFFIGSNYGTTYNHDIAIIEGTTGEYEPYGDIEEVIL